MYFKMIRLRFPKTLADQPIVATLVRDFDLTFNIFQALIYPRKEGVMVLELSGHRKNFARGIKYLKEKGIVVETVGQNVSRNDEVCYQCGLCTSICPTGALSLRRPEMEVVFDADKCSACEMCVAVCPPRAMHVYFNQKAAF